jgi:hypothetical protein
MHSFLRLEIPKLKKRLDPDSISKRETPRSERPKFRNNIEPKLEIVGTTLSFLVASERNKVFGNAAIFVEEWPQG